MRQIIIYLLLISASTSCLTSRYKVNEKGMKSNRELWVLIISELKVESINEKGFPSKYEIVNRFDTGQLGDHIYNDSIKEFGYNWKPQKKIPFKKKCKYYSWYSISDFKIHDTLPLIFKNEKWYLLTGWEPSSAGGGKYNLFVFINDNGDFEKHFDIETGPW